MTGFIFNYTFKDNSYLEITSADQIKYWEGEGLCSFEGTLDAWAGTYPTHMAVLIERKILKKN